MSASETGEPLLACAPAESAIVRAFYRVLLRREADEGGLLQHTRRLLADGLADGAPALLQEFLDSPEAAPVRVSQLLRAAAPTLAEPEARALSFISLGAHCYTSWTLKSAGLKKASMPFDWLFSSPAMVEHCLSDDFKTFLDPIHYTPVPVELRPHANANVCQHEFYRHRFGIEHVFNHRDPTRPDDYAYTRRCVERFRQACRNPSGNVFVCTARASAVSAQHFSALRRTLRGYAKRPFLVFIAFDEARQPYVANVRHSALESDSLYAELETVSSWSDLRFTSHADDIAVLSLIMRASAHLGGRAGM